jgi:hypothetical protein
LTRGTAWHSLPKRFGGVDPVPPGISVSTGIITPKRGSAMSVWRQRVLQ